MPLPNWSSARTTGGALSGVATGTETLVPLRTTRLVSGPGVACAVYVTGLMPSADACSVWVPAAVPRNHPPEVATPLPSVRAVSFTTRPPPLATRQRTSNPLMILPLWSVMRTVGTFCSTAPTRAVSSSVDTGAAAVGICGSSPQATSRTAANDVPSRRA